MKLTYRDKVILGIVLAIAIFVAGYFALIKPKNETIKNDNDKLSSLEETEKDYKKKIEQIEPLKKTINDTVAETNKITEKFVDRKKIENPVLLDQFMQHFANENNIYLKTLAAGDMADSSLAFYYIDGRDIGSGLRSLADINGDYQKEVDKANAEATAIKQRESSPVLITQYGITAEGKKEDLWKLMDAIEKYDDTLLINSVSFSRLAKKDEKEGSNENKSEEEEHKRIEPEDEVSISMVISLYSVYDLQQVNVDAIE